MSANDYFNLQMNFENSKITVNSKQLECEAIICQCVSPIHVKDESGKAFLKLGQQLNNYINRSMKQRFNRDFNLTILPQIYDASLSEKHVCATMVHGINPNNGQFIFNKGLIFDFILAGPVNDINDAYFSGLGSKTARGFGCFVLDI